MQSLKQFGRPIAFHPILIDLTGSLATALFLAQALYWQRRCPEGRDGWWFKTQDQWKRETRLGRFEQESARKRLRQLGILEEQRRGLPPRLWFRVDEARLDAILADLPTSEETPLSSGDPRAGTDFSMEIMPAPKFTDDFALESENCCSTADRNPSEDSSEITDDDIATKNNSWLNQWDDFRDKSINCCPTAIRTAVRPQIEVRPDSRLNCGGTAVPIAKISTEITSQPPPLTPSPSQPPSRGRGGGGEAVISGTPAEAGFERGATWNEKLLQAEEDLIFPKELSGPERQAACDLLVNCPVDARQAILDVLAVTIHAGEVRKSALSVLRGLVRRARDGTFDPGPGLHLAAERRRRARIQAALNNSRRQDLPALAPAQGPPMARIQALKQALCGGPL